MKMYLEKEDCEEIFHRALCSGLTCLEKHGLGLIYEETEYKHVEDKLKGDSDKAVWYEDILMEMLKSGYSITLYNAQGIEPDATITLDNVHNRASLAPAPILMDLLEGVEDEISSETLLQYVFLKKIIYS